ncbi:MAG: hypothetical protein VST70_01615 [Nitrospirota bacterium]|nr:hypothetical protein [Nitrospirota bacterium]
MTDPVLNKGNYAMRSDDPRCEQEYFSSNNPEFWGKTTEGLISWAYRRQMRSWSGKSGIVMSNEALGGEKSVITDYALIIAAIHRTLKLDHLILTVEALYGDDPDSLFGLVSSLSFSTRCSRATALVDIENYQLCRAISSNHPSRGEIVLNGWHKMAADVLDAEFRERGWVE